VWVLTRASNRASIEKQLGIEEKADTPRFIYLDLPKWVLWLKRHGVVPVQVYYVLWQYLAAHRVERKQLDIDVVHHVTFGNFQFPGMWWKGRWKVVLGPLGGIARPAEHYRRCFGTGWWREWLRLQMLRIWRLNPWTKRSFRCADALVFVTDEMARECGADHTCVHVQLDVAATDAILGMNVGRPVRHDFLWVGTIAGHKGWQLALEAFAMAFGSMHDSPHLVMLGEGPDKRAAQRLAEDLGITRLVEFRGQVDRPEVWNTLRLVKGLLFTSVRDTTGNVVLEAMSLQCPVICLNHNGAAQLTDQTCALRVKPGPWAATVTAFATALTQLERDASLVEALGRAGHRRIQRQFTWERKVNQMNEIFASVLGDTTCTCQAPSPSIGTQI
jgi:glycosyltransferase involved in cell wall biosynthesis